MADSDHSTTLPRVTRRRVLTGTAIAIAGWDRKAFARNDIARSLSSDPAIAVWREWRDAHRLTQRLCGRQQRLEQKLAATVGFPCATIQLRDGGSVTLHSLAALYDVLGAGPEGAVARAKAEADFAIHQARWDAADQQIGYSTALRAEREAADKAEALLEALAQTPATSLVGVAAKLDAVLREGETWDDEAEAPWPQIRLARDDLIRIGEELAPDQVFPDQMRRPLPRRRRGAADFRVANDTIVGAT